MEEPVRTECPAVRLTVEPHGNADALELAAVGGYRAVVVKGRYRTGDLAVYVPEGSIVPEYLQERLGLVGRLAGSQKNRVKAIRLRGVLSQGLVVPLGADGTLTNGAGGAVEVREGEDYAAFLGVEKYVPASMAGAVWAAGQERTLAYDVENVKRWPDVLVDGEEVVMTEKVHGTLLGVGVLPEALAHPAHGRVVVFSKGLGAKGLAFDTSEGDATLYTRTATDYGVADAVLRAFGDDAGALDEPVFVVGEVFGAGVQDLHYGADAGAGRLGFRVFDVYVGRRGHGAYLDDAALDRACAAMGLDRVPALYRGPYSDAALARFTGGAEAVSGAGAHLREGVVVRPTTERDDPHVGRVQLKSVSDDYLTRKGGTEYT
ncbi:RNA ligase (ATP) [Rubrivirga litoralis]|uniref:RNA ligase (ATP) n=1 Tax=Rubrivirga litoralis TaxID=3075598 RepID=A0ABU3BUD8_9BACT|nr:RNA ligase (ATP) [Rubrivirga sp. F394]MDT0632906.1 RNA ligase (ATP) [Rubrivirga sp. F394]